MHDRLLLVDNRTIFRQALHAALESGEGVTVVGLSGGGSDAIAQAKELQPDVILIDVHTAGTDVADLTARLRQEAPWSRILLLTADSPNSTLIYDSIRAGARGCVSQESCIDDVVEAIHLVAQGQAVFTAQSLTSLVDYLTDRGFDDRQPHAAENLSTREREVLGLIAQGRTNREIAQKLFVSESTVRTHVHSILGKLDLTNRVQAAAYALVPSKRGGSGVSPEFSLI